LIFFFFIRLYQHTRQRVELPLSSMSAKAEKEEKKNELRLLLFMRSP
jgi:hypothetical protein